MASRGVNLVVLVGNLGQDPDVRYTQSGQAIANFSIATSERWTDKNTGQPMEKTEWHQCKAFNKTAENIAQYLKKGSKVYIQGSIETDKWVDNQTGQNREAKKIKVSIIQFLDSSPQGQHQGHTPQANPQDNLQNPQFQKAQQMPAQQQMTGNGHQLQPGFKAHDTVNDFNDDPLPF